MTEYLTETAYMRWAKQYLVNVQFYYEAVEEARIRLARFAFYAEAEALGEQIGEIERKLQDAIPRDFSIGAEPLRGTQKFLENFKVLINLVLSLFDKEPRFLGIYQQEKARILDIHHEFNFKENLQEVEAILDGFERDEASISVQASAVAAV